MSLPSFVAGGSAEPCNITAPWCGGGRRATWLQHGRNMDSNMDHVAWAFGGENGSKRKHPGSSHGKRTHQARNLDTQQNMQTLLQLVKPFCDTYGML